MGIFLFKFFVWKDTEKLNKALLPLTTRKKSTSNQNICIKKWKLHNHKSIFVKWICDCDKNIKKLLKARLAWVKKWQ